MHTALDQLETYSRSAIGKVRLSKWYTTMSQKAKAKIVKDVTQLVLARRTRMCNFLEYKGASSSRCLCAVRAGSIGE